MHCSHYQGCHKWTMSIPFSPSNWFVLNRSFRNRMLYIRNLAATFGELFTCCYLWSKPCFSIQFLWCQRYVWLHYQRSTIACLHRLGAWIWYMQKNVRLRAKQTEFYQMYIYISFFLFSFNFWSVIFFALCDLTVEHTCVQQGFQNLCMDIRIFVVPWHQFLGRRFRISLCDLCCGYPWIKWRTCGSVGPGPLVIRIVKTAHLCL